MDLIFNSIYPEDSFRRMIETSTIQHELDEMRLTGLTQSPKSLSPLEKGLPMGGLYNLAKKEGNAKKPCYQIHKWWARRLGSIFRAMILATFSDSNHRPRDIWRQYYSDTIFGKTILDPFMGGGTTIIEGLRLGCKMVGVDVNPVAWFVTKKEVDEFDQEKADAVFHQIESRVGKTIQGFYATSCLNGHSANIIHTIWVQKLTCKKCRLRQLLLRDRVILDKLGRRVVVCAKCQHVFSPKSRETRLRCPSCRRTFSATSGVVENGTVICSNCGTEETIRMAVRRNKAPLPFEMACIEFDCEICGRGFKNPSRQDFKTYSIVEEKWRKEKQFLPYPKQTIPVRGRENRRPLTHGYRYYYELFNERQLLSLSLILKEVLSIQDYNLREFFLLVLSSTLETNNKFCKFETRWGKVSALFAFPGYHPVERFAENNLWGTDYGRGTFVRCFARLKRAKNFLLSPYERSYERRLTQKKTGNQVVGKSAQDFQDLVRGNGNSLLRCQSSEKLQCIPEKSIDAIITDPPYFNTIMYSELADFFYVWLRIGLARHYHWFGSTSSLGTGEIVLNPKGGIEVEDFLRRLNHVFLECRRVLKDDGLMALTFHHTSSIAWQGLKRVLRDSGWRITSVSVVRSEGVTGYIRGGMSHDACIVARKGSSERDIHESSTLVRSRIVRSSTNMARRLAQNNGTLRDVDLFTTVMSQCMRLDGNCDKFFENPRPLVAAVKRRLAASKDRDLLSDGIKPTYDFMSRLV